MMYFHLNRTIPSEVPLITVTYKKKNCIVEIKIKLFLINNTWLFSPFTN